jgi:hypothetical protein
MHTSIIFIFILFYVEFLGEYGVTLGGEVGSAAQQNYSSYESSSTTGYGAEGGAGGAFLAGGGAFQAGGGAFQAGGGSFQASGGAFQAGGGDASNGFYSSSSYGGNGGSRRGSISGLEAGFAQQGHSGASLAIEGGYGSSSFEQQSSSSTVYATDAQGLFKDPNPEIVRRPAPGGAQTYTQRITVKFLQPPAIPPPGVCISRNACI